VTKAIALASITLGALRMSTQKIVGTKLFYFAGAFIAFLIGSGFATGQEVLQYFTSYGYMGLVGAFVMFVLFLYVGIEFMTTGYREQFEKGSEIYKYYGGKYVGMFYDYFSILFIYMSFFVMIAGAGSTLQQQYGLPTYVGGIGIACAAGTTVLFGLDNIVKILGKIGPVIVVFSIALGIISIAKNPGGIAAAEAAIPSMTLMKASTNWLFAAMSYVGFCMLWLAAFLTAMGKTANSQKEARIGGALGAAGFSLAVIVVSLGLMAHFQEVAGTMVPTLHLAGKIHPWLAVLFSFIIILGIYTTAVPLLWSVSSRFAKDKTHKFRILTIILAIAGTFIGLVVPFNKLVNIVYVLNGYIGFLLIFLMLYKTFQRMKAKSNYVEKNNV